jgi:uncharacterized protein (TIGR02118 family)
VIRVSVLYPSGSGATFDMPYYVNRHMPMVQETLGPALKGVNVDAGLGSMEPGSPPPYLAMAHLLFDSVEVFQALFAQHGQAIMSDVPNYTNTQPMVQISQVKLVTT